MTEQLLLTCLVEVNSKSVSTYFHIQRAILRAGTAFTKPREQIILVLMKDNKLVEICDHSLFFSLPPTSWQFITTEDTAS